MLSGILLTALLLGCTDTPLVQPIPPQPTSPAAAPQQPPPIAPDDVTVEIVAPDVLAALEAGGLGLASVLGTPRPPDRPTTAWMASNSTHYQQLAVGWGDESARHLVYDGRKERSGRIPRCTRTLLQVYRDQLIDYRYGTFRSREPDDEIVSLILIIFD